YQRVSQSPSYAQFRNCPVAYKRVMMGIEIPDERCERVQKRVTRGREIEIAAPADAALSKQPTQRAGKRVGWIKMAGRQHEEILCSGCANALVRWMRQYQGRRPR